MNLEERFKHEKETVSRLLSGLFGQNSQMASGIAGRLETELADQVLFDHRHETQASLQAMWSSLPTISQSLATSGAGSLSDAELEPLAGATYAFRLLVLAHVVSEVESGAADRQVFQSVLERLGLGIQEVKSYRTDFVR